MAPEAEAKMKMWEFTSQQDGSGETISHVYFRISDDLDRTKQQQWIDVRLAVAEPIVRNGVVLRRKALAKLREMIDQLDRDLERLQPPAR